MFCPWMPVSICDQYANSSFLGIKSISLGQLFFTWRKIFSYHRFPLLGKKKLMQMLRIICMFLRHAAWFWSFWVIFFLDSEGWCWGTVPHCLLVGESLWETQHWVILSLHEHQCVLIHTCWVKVVYPMWRFLTQPRPPRTPLKLRY